jgi:hypothetical protein
MEVSLQRETQTSSYSAKQYTLTLQNTSWNKSFRSTLELDRLDPGTSFTITVKARRYPPFFLLITPPPLHPFPPSPHFPPLPFVLLPCLPRVPTRRVLIASLGRIFADKEIGAVTLYWADFTKDKEVLKLLPVHYFLSCDWSCDASE